MSLDRVSSGRLPFVNSRVRAYGKLAESWTDPTALVQNAIVLETATRGMLPNPHLGTFGASHESDSRAGEESRAKSADAAWSELVAIRSEMAGVEVALNALKGYDKLSVMGRPVVKQSQEQLRKRAELLHHAHQRRVLESAGVKLPPLAPTSASTALPSKFTIGMAEATSKLFLEEGRSKASAVGASKVPVPVGRVEAVILGKALQDLLPEGVITAKYLGGTVLGRDMQSGSSLKHTEAISKDWELLDMVLEEICRQVTSNCVDRGQVLNAVRRRQKEVFDVLTRSCKLTEASHVLLQQTAWDMQQNLHNEHQRIEETDQELRKARIELDTLREKLDFVHKEKIEIQENATETITQLQNDRTLLEREVHYYENRLQDVEREQEKAIDDAVARIEDDLVTAIEERDDLRERIMFMEKQLRKARDERRRQISSTTVEVQTEVTGSLPMSLETVESDSESDEGTGANKDVRPKRSQSRMRRSGGSGHSGDAALSSSKSVGKGQKGKAKGKKKKKKRDLGGFSKLIASDKVGRLKGRQWVLKTIAQIYTDKIVADAVDDREQSDRAEICDYVFDWHLNRYGLRNLAEINLLDLIVSVRTHAEHSAKIRVFGVFCAILDPGRMACALSAMNFYLVCLQHLAHPYGIVALFPENSEDGTCVIKHMQASAALRSIFREMEDPDGVRAFMAKYVDPLQASDGTSDTDTLLLILMEEWARRYEQNTKDLVSLFQGGDRDNDGKLSYSEFIDVMKHVLPVKHERTLTRLFRNGLQLQKGGDAIEPEAFLKLARKNGLAYWRLRFDELPSNPEPETGPPNVEEKNPTEEKIFEGIERSMGLAVPTIGEQIQEAKLKAEDWEGVLHLDDHYDHLKHLLEKRKSAPAAFIAHELLMEQIQHAKGPHKHHRRKVDTSRITIPPIQHPLPRRRRFWTKKSKCWRSRFQFKPIFNTLPPEMDPSTVRQLSEHHHKNQSQEVEPCNRTSTSTTTNASRNTGTLVRAWRNAIDRVGPVMPPSSGGEACGQCFWMVQPIPNWRRRTCLDKKVGFHGYDFRWCRRKVE